MHAGGSGNFNWYGDLGEVLPGVRNSSSGFVTLAGNNGGSWLGKPIVLQHWATQPLLHITHNTSATVIGTPPQFSGSCGPKRQCGLGQGGKVVRDSSGVLLSAWFGFASNGPTLCKPGEADWNQCYTLAFYRSRDSGTTWNYASRLDQTTAMPT